MTLVVATLKNNFLSMFNDIEAGGVTYEDKATAAQVWADSYDNYAKNATDNAMGLYPVNPGNAIVTPGNIALMKTTLESGFSTNGTPTATIALYENAITAYWTGVTFGFLIVPPPGIIGISNIVTITGSGLNLDLSLSNDAVAKATSLSSSFDTRTKTVKTLLTYTIPTPPGVATILLSII